jgi:nitrogen fixation/metabolism regulation signal transduction histidine kinase
MAVTTDILRAYARPRAVMRDRLRGASEERALIFLMVACFVFFVARLPSVARDPQIANPEIGFIGVAMGLLLGTVFFAPLMFYALAAISHIAARIVGGKGSWLSARMALFWSLLVAVPMVLLHGLVAAFVGPGLLLTALSVVFGAAFLWVWGQNMIAAEGSA